MSKCFLAAIPSVTAIPFCVKMEVVVFSKGTQPPAKAEILLWLGLEAILIIQSLSLS